MIDKIFIGPKRPGAIIYNFQRQDWRPLAQEGEYVDPDPQWLRYIDAGDVEIKEPPKQKISKKGDEA